MRTLLALCAGMLFCPLMAGDAQKYLYLRCYLEFNIAKDLRKAGDFLGAIADLKDAIHFLKDIYRLDPSWESALVLERIKDGEKELKALEPLARQQVVQEIRKAGTADVLMSRLLRDAQRSEELHKDFAALKKYERYLATAEAEHALDPNWEAASNVKVQAEVGRLHASVDARSLPDLQAGDGVVRY